MGQEDIIVALEKFKKEHKVWCCRYDFEDKLKHIDNPNLITILMSKLIHHEEVLVKVITAKEKSKKLKQIKREDLININIRRPLIFISLKKITP